MRGLAIGRALGNICSPFCAQPGCFLLLNGRNCCSRGWTTGVWASAGCSGRSQPAQPSQDSCWGLMERWITSQAAAAARMNLQNSSDLAECLRLILQYSLSCVLRVGWGWVGEWVRKSLEWAGKISRFSNIFIHTRTTQGMGSFIRKGYWASTRVPWPTDIGAITGSLRSHCWDLPTAPFFGCSLSPNVRLQQPPSLNRRKVSRR